MGTQVTTGQLSEMFNYQYWIRRLLLWLIDEQDLPGRQAVNIDDEGDYEAMEHHVDNLKRKRPETADIDIDDALTKEEIAEKFKLLKEAFEDLKGKMIMLEFEVDHLKDEKAEKEEEMKLHRVELQKLIEFTKVLKQEREGDKHTIKQQKDIIQSFSKDFGMRDIT